MAVTTKFPTANETVVTGWTNPNNAHADEGTYTTAAPAKSTTVSGNWLTFGFDGDIPAGSAITKIQIIYEFKVSATNSIATMRVAAVIGGVNEENHDDATEPTSDKIVTVDITADRTWTRANLLDANFKVYGAGVRGNDNDAVTFSLDYIKVEVTYISYSLAASGGSFVETEVAAGLYHGYKLSVANGAYVETGGDAALGRTYIIAAGSGAFVETGKATPLLHKHIFAAISWAFIETGMDVTLSYAGGDGVIWVPQYGMSM